MPLKLSPGLDHPGLIAALNRWADYIETQNTKSVNAILFATNSANSAGAAAAAAVSQVLFTVISESGAYTANSGDFVTANTSGGGFTVTLPAAASNKSAVIGIKKISSDSNTLTIMPNGSDTIDQASSQSIIFQHTALTLLSDGVSNWDIF